MKQKPKKLTPNMYWASKNWVWISPIASFTEEWMKQKLPFRQQRAAICQTEDVFVEKWLYNFYWKLYYSGHSAPRKNPECDKIFKCTKALCDDEDLRVKYMSLFALDDTYPLEQEFFKDFPAFKKTCSCCEFQEDQC